MAVFDPQSIARFVPRTVQQRVLADALAPGELAETRAAAVVFADIAGFTGLSQRLDHLGARGAEELTGLLNSYYGPLVDEIYAHGGDVVRFAGDALLAVWTTRADDLARCTALAAQACLSIQTRLTEVEVAPGLRFSLRLSVAAGDLTIAAVGGVDDYWQLVVYGDPIEQLRRADRLGQPGRTVVSPEAASRLADRLVSEALADGFLWLHDLKLAEPLPEPMDGALTADDEEPLRQFVPKSMLARIDAGQGEWLADLLRVTALFVRLERHGDEAPDARSLQAAMSALQQTARQYRGTVLQIMLDDKGTVAIVGFGLPPYEGEDCSARAVALTRALTEMLAARGLRASMGLASGPAFCGPLGGARHQEYTVIGSVMNRAARLMQYSGGDALCDEAVCRELDSPTAFQPLPRFRLKGFADPVPVYRLKDSAAGGPPRLFGRARERDLVGRAVAAALAGESRQLLFEGEPGIGKSALLRDLMAQARQQGLPAWVGECSLVEQTTAYYPWRGVFDAALRLSALADAAARRQSVLDRLADEQQRQLAPLLNPVLRLDFADNEIAAQITGATRADNLHALLLTLLESILAERGALAIVLDDMQWADWASWQLAVLVARRIRPALITLFMRTLAEPHPPAYRELLTMPAAQQVKLDLLAPDDTRSLVRQVLGINDCDDRLGQFVHERSQGNPFFAEELTNLLRETGAAEVVAGRCALAEMSAEELAEKIPRRVSDLITSRVNQLEPPQRLVLQVASVIGRVFGYHLLSDTYPVERNRPQLPEFLTSLEQQDLVRPEAIDLKSLYAFRHVTIQQVTYEQITQRQRQSLHASIATWLEQHDQSTAANYPLLAWHWGLAGHVEQELKYLNLAGEEALRAGASREAVALFEKALSRLAVRPETDGRQEPTSLRARWTRQLGEALFQLGDLASSRQKLEEALRLLGYHVPDSRRATAVSALAQVAVQLWHRAWRRRARPADTSPTPREQAIGEAALANQRISQICYFTNEIGVGMDRALTAMNLAERIQESPGLAVSYANMSIVATVLRVEPLARFYARMAERVGRATHNLAALTYTLTVTNMYWLGRGRWSKVAEGCDEAIGICRQLGDQRQLAEAVTVAAMLNCFVGKFADSLRQFDEVTGLGQRCQNVLHEAWGYCGRGECLWRLGKTDEALAALNHALRLLRDRNDRTEEIRANGLLAAIHAGLGNWPHAQQFADATEALIAASAHVTASTLEGLAGLVEARLRGWQASPDDAARARQTVQAQRLLDRYARVFPIGRPRAAQMSAWADAVAGRLPAARRKLLRSIAQAEDLELVLEQALSHARMAHGVASDELRREQHASEATRLFDRLQIAPVAG